MNAAIPTLALLLPALLAGCGSTDTPPIPEPATAVTFGYQLEAWPAERDAELKAMLAREADMELKEHCFDSLSYQFSHRTKRLDAAALQPRLRAVTDWQQRVIVGDIGPFAPGKRIHYSLILKAGGKSLELDTRDTYVSLDGQPPVSLGYIIAKALGKNIYKF